MKTPQKITSTQNPPGLERTAGAAVPGDPVGTAHPPPTRRQFLGQISVAAAGAVGLPLLGQTATADTAKDLGQAATTHTAKDLPRWTNERQRQAYQMRVDAAYAASQLPAPVHATNGDEERYPHKIGNYSKALPHNALGEVKPAAYRTLVDAVTSGRTADLDAMPQFGVIKQTNPQAAHAFDLVGADCQQLDMPPPPSFSSEDQAAEMAELYWLALTRDIPYVRYGEEPLIQAAIKDLARFKLFADVTAATLFRGPTPGDRSGPYLSQFLWKDIPFAATTLVQRYRITKPGLDYMTDYTAWLDIQDGGRPRFWNKKDPTARCLLDNRGLGEWVHRDFTYQAFLGAAMILLNFGDGALDDGNPYKTSLCQTGFATFGGPHILDCVARVANLALMASWYQKWLVHRRTRPEEFGGRVHNHLARKAEYPIHGSLLDSPALERVFAAHKTYLLPQAYAEGCPTHPAYPGGHAIIAGACTTVLKAFFKESYPIQSPLMPSDDGLNLVPYRGPLLTIGGELDKLAGNIALGRGAAGIHWRSDNEQGLLLGEAVAMNYLRDYRHCYREDFDGFSYTSFEGKAITV